jgi:hypothetical protein
MLVSFVRSGRPYFVQSVGYDYFPALKEARNNQNFWNDNNNIYIKK